MREPTEAEVKEAMRSMENKHRPKCYCTRCAMARLEAQVRLDKGKGNA